MNIRFANQEDTILLLPLYKDLGYPSDFETLYKRLSRILSNKDYHILAVEGNGKFLAFAGFSQMSFFESDDDYLRILAFATSNNDRRKGIATLLLDEIKLWCNSHGIKSIVLNSGIREERQPAHKFYEHYGFVYKSFGYYLNF